MPEPEDKPFPSPIEIKRGIILMLISRPNNSCMKKALVSLVAKEMELDYRGHAREAISHDIRRASADLKKASIVIYYKAKNERIKLLPGYEKKFLEIEKQYEARLRTSKIEMNDHDQEPNDDVDLSLKWDEEAMALDQEEDFVQGLSLSPAQSFPDLPDPLATESRGDSLGNISILEASDTLILNKLTEISKISSTNVLALLVKSLFNQYGIKARQIFNALKFETIIDGIYLSGTVELRNQPSEVSVAVSAPFVNGMALPVLSLVGVQGIRSIPCVLTDGVESQLVLRRYTDWRKLTLESLEGFVAEVISDFSKLTPIIKTPEK